MKKLSMLFYVSCLLSIPILSIAETYQITNCYELQEMNNDLSGQYVLTDDIDCSDTVNWNDGKGFAPIGSDIDEVFTGSLNGRHHVIKNLYMDRPDENGVGLFGIAFSPSKIANIGLVKFKITGDDDVGSLVGHCAHAVSITNCFSATGLVIGNSNCGGLIGRLSSSEAIVENSYSSVNVCSKFEAGGLIGYNNGSEITNCYSAGDVFGSGFVGGLVGRDELGNETYINCFAVGHVFCYPYPFDEMIGGLIGHSHGSPTIINSYWLDHRFDCADQCVGDYETECDANARSSLHYFLRSNNEPMASWDFDDIWDICEGRTLPFLKWQKVSCKKFIPRYWHYDKKNNGKRDREPGSTVRTFSIPETSSRPLN